MKLFGSTKIKITKDKNGENVLHLEIAVVVLVYFNIVNNDYLQHSRILYTFHFIHCIQFPIQIMQKI